MVVDGTLGCDRNRVPELSKVSNVVHFYDITDFS
jgi:hypothetical protein